MYYLYDKNVSKVMNFLDSNNYSLSVIYAHRKCFKDFRAFLEKLQTDYSFEIATSWLDKNKIIWSHAKYKVNRLSIHQLNDVYARGKLTSNYVYDNSPNYKRLPNWCRIVLDEYLDIQQQSITANHVNTKRIECSHFLNYICTIGVTKFEEITYHHIISYYNISSHTSQKCKDHYESTIRKFLKYLHYKIKFPLSISFALNKTVLPFVLSQNNFPSYISDEFYQLSEPNPCNLKALEFHNKTTEIIDILLIEYKYGKTTIKMFRRAFKLFFIFLESKQLYYSPKLVGIWLDYNKGLIRTSWQSYRRAFRLLEQYIQEGNITPEKVFTYKKDSLMIFPEWCRNPLESYLALKGKEGFADSTVAMHRSSCIRFLSYVIGNNLLSFREITPTIIKEFSIVDKHNTIDGKNAYNVRIRMFLEYLEECNLVPKSLHLAISCLSAPSTRIVKILNDSEINIIKDYCKNSKTPMELRNGAITQLGLKMGLRPSDIVNLKLTDISWQNSCISLTQQKTGVGLTIPMPISVGNIIYRYITQGRPKSNTIYVFINHRAPYQQSNRSICQKALSKIFEEPWVGKGGFRITRKTFASKLLSSGASLNTIIDCLGHQSTCTVFKYLALNEEKMRLCPISLTEAGIMLKGGV